MRLCPIMWIIRKVLYEIRREHDNGRIIILIFCQMILRKKLWLSQINNKNLKKTLNS